jgi:hypothetical protein
LLPFAQSAGIRGDGDRIGILEASALATAEHNHMTIPSRLIFSQEVVHHRIITFCSLPTRNEHITRSIRMCERENITFEKPSGQWSGFGISRGGNNKLRQTRQVLRLVGAKRRNNPVQRRETPNSMFEKLVK